MRIQILDEAEQDLQDGCEFYERQETGVGDYFAAALAADIDSLILFAGIHPMEFVQKYFCSLPVESCLSLILTSWPLNDTTQNRKFLRTFRMSSVHC